MDNRNIFRVSASNGIDKTQLANAEGSDNSRDTLDSSVPIRSIASIEFVAITNPI